MKFPSKYTPALLYFFSLIILFSSIYIPRYTRLSKLRQITCREKEISVVVPIVRLPEQYSAYQRYETGEFKMDISQDQVLELGKTYSMIGRISDPLQCEKREEIVLRIQSIRAFKDNRVSVFYLPVKAWQSIQIWLSRYQLQYEHKLRRFLSPQQVDVVLGMFLGRRPSREHGIGTLFQQVGVIHILVASGANIALIYSFTQNVMRKIYSRKISNCFASITILMYALIVGWQAPIVRALCMVGWSGLAKGFGRRSYAFLSLIHVVLFLLIIQPFLIYSPSFYLTVFATLGMVVTENEAQTMGIRAQFFTGLVIFIFTLPIVCYLFGTFSLLGVLVTVIIAWLIPVLTNLSLVLFLLSFIPSMMFFGVILIPLWFLTEVLVRFINVFSRLSFLTATIRQVSLHEVVAIYLIIFSVTLVALADRNRPR